MFKNNLPYNLIIVNLFYTFFFLILSPINSLLNDKNDNKINEQTASGTKQAPLELHFVLLKIRRN